MFRSIKFLLVLVCSLFVMGMGAAHADAEFTITTTPDTTTFSFQISAAGEFTVDWGDGSEVQTITKANTNNTTYSHTYSAAGAYNIGLSGQATAYNTSYSNAAVSFQDNKNIAGISGSLGAIFGTLDIETNIQPRFYNTFYGCTNMTGSIPTDLFSGISGAPATYMFYYTFSKCSGLTGNVPRDLFSGISGRSADRMFAGTFSGCSGLTGYVDGNMFSGITGDASYAYSYAFNDASGMDTLCPAGAYAVTKPDSSWPVAVCSLCPDEYPLSNSGATSINLCHTVSAPCMAGQYYDTDTSQCVICPADSYCAGEVKTYYDGRIYDVMVCPDGTTSAQGSTNVKDCNTTSEFVVTTTSDTTTFSFRMSAAGTFYVDWGDGNIETIIKNDTTDATFVHEYNVMGAYNIGFFGQATAYATSTTAISFSGNKNVAGISGSLGAIFGTLSSGTNPRFGSTFYSCSNMTGSIPAGLFSGVSGKPVDSMFASTFYGCSGLSGSIPADLFRTIEGAPAAYMFGGTFYGCSGLTGSIPEDLFAGISGAPQVNMFHDMFFGCKGLTGSIPENLFAGISGSPRRSVFLGVFNGCTGLTGNIPAGLFRGIKGAPDTYMFSKTFRNCSGLTGSIPTDLFSGIKGAVAQDMFSYTFEGCTNLTGSIPADLFGDLSGAPKTNMFASTFDGCSGLTGDIPENLFAGISGTPASSMFSGTFSGCSGLTGEISANLFSGIRGAPASSMFSYTFSNCSGLTGSIPENLFGRIKGAAAYRMFGSTFYNCKGLTGSLPMNLFSGISGPAKDYMFDDTFYGCSGLTGYVDGRMFPIPAGSASRPYSSTFKNNTNMDKKCPGGTYKIPRLENTWGNVAFCLPCPDEYPDSDSEAPSVDMCYVAQSCDGGAYYDAATAQCTQCPAGSYCVGGTKKAYSNGNILGESLDAVLCPGGSTSPAGSVNVDACACNTGFAFNSVGLCSALCGSGVTKLQTSSGLSVPLFAAKTTSPSIFVSNRADAMCYADLVTGAASGAINVNYNGAVYHTVQ